MRPIIVVIAMAASSAASANLIVHNEFRVVTARATVDAVTDQPVSLFAAPLTEFNEFISANVATSGGAAGATARQFSLYLPDRITARGSANSSASSLSGASIDTAATSVFDLTFSVLEETQIQISSSTSGLGAVLFGIDAGPAIFSGSGLESFTLTAGTRYRLTASAGAALDAPGSAGGGYILTVTGIPAPGPTVLLAGAGLLVARRRR